MSDDDERRMSSTQSETETKELDFIDRDPKKISEIYKVLMICFFFNCMSMYDVIFEMNQDIKVCVSCSVSV